MAERNGRHVLIIEDEMLIALDVEAMLADLGYSTFDIADSAATAVACACSRHPDLITADARIVGGTGMEAVDAIVAAIGPVPVVFVTGNRDMLSHRAAATIVDKPISPRALEAACIKVWPADGHNVSST